MNGNKLVRILFINILINIEFNWLLYGHFNNHLLQSDEVILLANLIVYTIQISFIYYLLDTKKAWLTDTLQRKYVLYALGAIMIVYIIETILISSLHSLSLRSYPLWRLGRFLLVFFLYSLPAAFIEEFLFRHFPYQYNKNSQHQNSSILVYGGLLILFVFNQIPVHIFKYNLDTSGLIKYIVSDFMIGIFLLIIYLMTKNLVFTSLCNALNHEPFFPFYSHYNYFFLYSSILVIGILWAVLNQWTKRQSVGM